MERGKEPANLGRSNPGPPHPSSPASSSSFRQFDPDAHATPPRLRIAVRHTPSSAPHPRRLHTKSSRLNPRRAAAETDAIAPQTRPQSFHHRHLGAFNATRTHPTQQREPAFDTLVGDGDGHGLSGRLVRREPPRGCRVAPPPVRSCASTRLTTLRRTPVTHHPRPWPPICPRWSPTAT